MAQEISLFVPFAPELDGEGEGVDGLAVAADEAAAEVNVFEIVFFGLEVGDLTDVVTVRLRVSVMDLRRGLGGEVLT